MSKFKFVALIHVILFTTQVRAGCRIEMYGHIFTHFSMANDGNYVKRSNCSSATLTELQSFIKSNTGVFSAKSLAKHVYRLTQNEEIDISPDKIVIERVSDVIRREFGVPNSIQINNVTHLGGTYSIGIDKFNFDKENDFSKGTVKLSDGLGKVTWLKFNVKKLGQSVIAIKSIAQGEELIENQNVIVKEDYLDSFDNLMTKFIPYTVATKSIGANEIIRRDSYRQNTLVTARSPVSVILKSNNIKLSTNGVALQAGLLGAEIRVKLENTNKVVIGNVIAPNKVVVEL